MRDKLEGKGSLELTILTSMRRTDSSTPSASWCRCLSNLWILCTCQPLAWGARGPKVHISRERRREFPAVWD